MQAMWSIVIIKIYKAYKYDIKCNMMYIWLKLVERLRVEMYGLNLWIMMEDFVCCTENLCWNSWLFSWKFACVFGREFGWRILCRIKYGVTYWKYELLKRVRWWLEAENTSELIMTLDVAGGAAGIGSLSRQAQPTSGTCKRTLHFFLSLYKE